MLVTIDAKENAVQPDPETPLPGARRPGRSGRAPLRPHPGLHVLRALLGLLALTLGIVLLARGDLVLGVLVTSLAVVRMAIVLATARGRSRWRQAVGQRR